MITSQNKKVSVIVPNYNYSRYIKQRIKSILKQTYPISELIILDDASTDGSREIIEDLVKGLKKKNLKVKFLANDVNSGKAMLQWKKGFEMATGDFVWIAEADDLANRKFLEEAMKGFNDPDVVLSYTESMIINSRGLILAPNFRWSRDKEKTGHYKKSYIREGKEEIREIMAIRCTIPNVSAVVFKNDKKYLKYFDRALEFSQVGDWYFYVKILENGKISYNRKALNKFRVHGGSVTNKHKTSEQHLDEIREMHKKIDEKYKLAKEVKTSMKKEELRFIDKMGR